MTDQTASTLVTPAWLMAGRLRNVHGVLAAGDGKLAFVTEDGPVFAVPITQVTDVTWPWHWFGGGVKLRAAGEQYKITFVRPNGAPDPSPSLLETGAAVLFAAVGEAVAYHSVRGLADVRSGKKAANAWKALLPNA